MPQRSDEFKRKCLEVFSVCAVCHAMSKREKQELPDEESEVELADSFMADSGCLASPLVDSPPAPIPPSVVSPASLAISSLVRVKEPSSKALKCACRESNLLTKT